MAGYRRPLIIGFLLLLCLAVGEFWLYSAHRLGDYMHKRALGGVSVADLCQSSDIGGFPFRLKVSCDGFAAPVRMGGRDDLLRSRGSARHRQLVFAQPHPTGLFQPAGRAQSRWFSPRETAP